ncbi:Protein O-mannosyl-transferase TMTC3 [Geodia barretti]|uniref:dolichyl-phosphate-mannose--protein mannosyltransferase n=1 Tax=Geodia barretti TaxID=519541 RepID=A0AA35WZB8_GEOBA|nr:Protein O-mannosyl-transferase TMTC3 [Geodia barretti]
MCAKKIRSLVTVNRAALLCSLLTICLFLNSLEGELVFDDTAAIVGNDDVQMKTPWRDLLRNDYWGTRMNSTASHKSYRPLTVATFRLNYMLHELEPLGYHLVNVLLHSAVVYLYVLLCGVVFSEVWPALIAGLLFAVHPIHTEAVCGVVGRAELLCAVFFILSFTAYEKAKRGNSTMWLLGSWLLAVVSMLCKEQGITVVAICAAYDILQNYQENRQSLLKLLDTMVSDLTKTPLWLVGCGIRAAVVGVPTALVLAVRLSVGEPSRDLFHQNVNPPLALETPYRQLSWAYLSFVNSWLLLNPWNLNIDWRFGAVPLINSLTDPLNLLTLLVLGCLTGLAAWSLSGRGERHRTVAISLSLLVLPYLPASNLFFPVGFVVAERVLYIPSMGFCMLVGFGAWQLIQTTTNKTLKNIIVCFIVYILAVQSVKTVARNPEWKSHIPLFESGIRLNPRNGLLLSNLGKELKEAGDWELAEKVLKRAVEVSPTHSGGHMNLGKIQFHSKRYSEAIPPLRKALELIPADGNGSLQIAATSYLLAVSMAMDSSNQTALTEALAICNAALRRRKSSSILIEMKELSQALQTAEAGLRHNSSAHELHLTRATILRDMGEREEAKQAYRTALENKSDFLLAIKRLAFMYSEDNQHDLALPLWEKVREYEPSNQDCYNGLATALFIAKDYDKSEEVLTAGYKLFPKNINIIFNLGNLYLRMDRREQSLHFLQLTMELDPNYRNVKTLIEQKFKDITN